MARQPKDSETGSTRRRVAVDALRPGMFLEDLNLPWAQHPFLTSRFELDEASIARIRSLGLRTVWVRGAEGEAGGSAPADVPEPPTSEQEEAALHEAAERAGRAGTVTREARSLVQQMLEDARVRNVVDYGALSEVSDELMGAVDYDQDSMLAMGRLRSCDGYTYQHSVNVGVLLIAFARHLDLPADQIRLLGVAGLLHDVGKAFVPAEILTKPGKLSNEEYKRIKEHPVLGAELLRGIGGIPPVVIEIAERHHERMDGRGYPYRLSSERLSREARMSGIVDVYDAVTAVRAYHEGRPPTEGMKIVLADAGKAFDRELTYQMVRCIGVYPPGALVRLSSGHLAVVLASNAQEPEYPRVRVIYDPKRGRLMKEPVDQDLARTKKIRVAGHEDPGQWSLHPEVYLGLGTEAEIHPLPP